MYGSAINVPEHVSDVIRVDLMIKYGGIYVDTDVVFVRPLDRSIRRYDAVVSYELPRKNHPFPDIINSGVILARRNAPFWHKFQVTIFLRPPPSLRPASTARRYASVVYAAVVCLSLCLTHSGIVSKWLNVG